MREFWDRCYGTGRHDGAARVGGIVRQYSGMSDLAGCTLEITVPTTAAPASASISGTSVTGRLGAVTDGRGVDPAAWIATVASSDYTSGSHTIPASGAANSAGTLTTTGNPTFGDPTVPSMSATPASAVTAKPWLR